MSCSVFQALARKSDQRLRSGKEDGTLSDGDIANETEQEELDKEDPEMVIAKEGTLKADRDEDQDIVEVAEDLDYTEVLYVLPEQEEEDNTAPDDQQNYAGNASSGDGTPETYAAYKMLHTSEGSFRSVDCDRRLKTKVNLNRHKLRRAQAGYELGGYFRQFLCDFCDLKFKTKRDLNLHELTHPRVQQIFECDECGQVFDEQLRMINHRRTHSIKEAPLKCNVCGRTFVNEGSYHVHLRTQH